MTLVLAACAAAIFAGHASWPWVLAGRGALPPAQHWLDRSPRWALAALTAAVIAGFAALAADVDRRLVFGGLWGIKALRFAVIATVGLALADLVLLLAPRESRERRGTWLIGVLGITSVFGFCWVFEVARAWGESTPRAVASALALAAAAALLARPDFSGGWSARIAAAAVALALAAYAPLAAPQSTTTADATTLRLAPLAAAAALAAAEAWIPRRLRGLCRGLAIALVLLSLRSAWTEASVTVPFSTQPQPSIPKF